MIENIYREQMAALCRALMVAIVAGCASGCTLHANPPNPPAPPPAVHTICQIPLQIQLNVAPNRSTTVDIVTSVGPICVCSDRVVRMCQ